MPLSTFLSMLQSGRMPQALLVTGIPGVGKTTFALKAASFILMNGQISTQASLLRSARNDDQLYNKLAKDGVHPDFLMIKPDTEAKTKTISVDEARKIAPFLHMTSAHGNWRVVLIDGADYLNLNGQNAILKILEEPPSKTLLLLTTCNAGALLPTIRSRTSVLNIPAKPLDEICGVLRATCPGLSNSDADTLARMSEGSIGRALYLAQNEGLAVHGRLSAIVQTMPRIDEKEVQDFAEYTAKDSDLFEIAKDTLLWLLHGKIKAMLSDAKCLEHLLAARDKIGHLFSACENSSLDKKHTMMLALLALQ